MKTPQQIVNNFFELVSSSNADAAFQLVSDEVKWWIPEELPFSGTKNKKEYFAIVNRIQSGFPTGFKLLVRSTITEGNKIAAEVESEGIHVNGKSYNNKYHFLIEIENGVIISVKEYMNTLHLFKLIS